jgi:hypothetical protein
LKQDASSSLLNMLDIIAGGPVVSNYSEPRLTYSLWNIVRRSLQVPLLLLLTGAGRYVSEAPFLKANAVAMDRMMAGMSVRPSGDVDQDFVSMMEPHHQGAVDMAQAELRYGHNEQLRRIAQEIIVEQLQEIGAMRVATGRPLRLAAPAPDQQPPMSMSGMEMKQR